MLRSIGILKFVFGKLSDHVKMNYPMISSYKTNVSNKTFITVTQVHINNVLIYTGPMKVVHMTGDYKFGLLYQCGSVQTYGTCSVLTIDVVGRGTELPEEVKAEMVPYADQLCVSLDQFTIVDHEGEISGGGIRLFIYLFYFS